jgi:hypothetical protein
MTIGFLVAGFLFVAFALWSLTLMDKATEQWRVAASRLPERFRLSESFYLTAQRLSSALAAIFGLILITIALIWMVN